ncbi:MAG: glycosyltransferase family 2 protein [Myxococcota bacterium]
MKQNSRDTGEYIPEISIIIPAYNEAASIKQVLTKLQKVLNQADFTYEILVINDGSTDGTGDILANLNVRTINHEINRGYGASLKTGVRSIQSEFFVIIDADGTYPEEELLNITAYRHDYDMIIAARTGENVNIPLIRKPAKKFITWLASYVANRRIPDLNSGLRIMRREVVLKYIKLLPDGFSFTSTISLAMLVGGFRVKYIPINYKHREGTSKIRPFYDTINFILLIVRTITYFRPLRVFVPFSLFLFLTGIFVLFFSGLFFEQIMDSTSTIFIMTAVNIFGLGLLAELIIRRSD